MQTFNRIVAQMFVQPCTPDGTHLVSRLQDGPHSRSRATPHEPEMTAMIARQQFDNSARFAMPPDAQNPGICVTSRPPKPLLK